MPVHIKMAKADLSIMFLSAKSIEIHDNDIGCIGGDIRQDEKSPRQEISA